VTRRSRWWLSIVLVLFRCTCDLSCSCIIQSDLPYHRFRSFCFAFFNMNVQFVLPFVGSCVLRLDVAPHHAATCVFSLDIGCACLRLRFLFAFAARLRCYTYGSIYPTCSVTVAVLRLPSSLPLLPVVPWFGFLTAFGCWMGLFGSSISSPRFCVFLRPFCHRGPQIATLLSHRFLGLRFRLVSASFCCSGRFHYVLGSCAFAFSAASLISPRYGAHFMPFSHSYRVGRSALLRFAFYSLPRCQFVGRFVISLFRYVFVYVPVLHTTLLRWIRCRSAFTTFTITLFCLPAFSGSVIIIINDVLLSIVRWCSSRFVPFLVSFVSFEPLTIICHFTMFIPSCCSCCNRVLVSMLPIHSTFIRSTCLIILQVHCLVTDHTHSLAHTAALFSLICDVIVIVRSFPLSCILTFLFRVLVFDSVALLCGCLSGLGLPERFLYVLHFCLDAMFTYLRLLVVLLRCNC